jgi:hypothetical protein
VRYAVLRRGIKVVGTYRPNTLPLGESKETAAWRGLVAWLRRDSTRFA